jgi:hypothetical protein
MRVFPLVLKTQRCFEQSLRHMIQRGLLDATASSRVAPLLSGTSVFDLMSDGERNLPPSYAQAVTRASRAVGLSSRGVRKRGQAPERASRQIN